MHWSFTLYRSSLWRLYSEHSEQCIGGFLLMWLNSVALFSKNKNYKAILNNSIVFSLCTRLQSLKMQCFISSLTLLTPPTRLRDQSNNSHCGIYTWKEHLLFILYYGEKCSTHFLDGFSQLTSAHWTLAM